MSVDLYPVMSERGVYKIFRSRLDTIVNIDGVHFDNESEIEFVDFIMRGSGSLTRHH